jgi:hypothetical protein
MLLPWWGAWVDTMEAGRRSPPDVLRRASLAPGCARGILLTRG